MSTNTETVINWLKGQSYGRIFTTTEVRAETGINSTVNVSRTMESLRKSGYVINVGETTVKGKGYRYRVIQWRRSHD